MPYSYPKGKQEVKEHFLRHIPLATNILDVGAGCGTYGNLLAAQYKKIDAIEIHEPNIKNFNLNAIYRKVYLGNILEFKHLPLYQYFILGDVLEHMTVVHAQRLLNTISKQNGLCMVAVPFMYEQGRVDGNAYEEHLQPDLTHEVFATRYPFMRPLFIYDNKYGYYINYSI